MGDGFHCFDIVGTYAATDEEGASPTILVEPLPFKLPSAASLLCTFGIEEKIVRSEEHTSELQSQR